MIIYDMIKQLITIFNKSGPIFLWQKKLTLNFSYQLFINDWSVSFMQSVFDWESISIIFMYVYLIVFMFLLLLKYYKNHFNFYLIFFIHILLMHNLPVDEIHFFNTSLIKNTQTLTKFSLQNVSKWHHI
jgi:hypothetical protein